MKNLPNLITLTRILSAIALLSANAFSDAFFVFYTYCGISDVLDGALARTLHYADEIGAKLDSIADIVFYAAAAFKIFPALRSELTPLIWCIIAAAEELLIHASAVEYNADRKTLFEYERGNESDKH